jgi:Flp pilus assembly protein TadD
MAWNQQIRFRQMRVWRSNLTRTGLLLAAAIGLTACSSNKPVPPIVPPSEQPPSLANTSMSDRHKDMIKLAEATRQAGDFATAAGVYRKLVADGDTSLSTELGLADCLLGTGDLASAADAYKQAETEAPTDPRPEIGLGRLNLVEHKPAVALSAYALALQIDPTNLVAINGKGVALDLMGRHADAQQVYREGLIADPQDRTLRNNLGLSLIFSKKYDEAVAILTTLAQDSQATARNRQNLALALGMQGDKADAKMVASRDLDDDSVENNLRYYDYARSGPDTDADAGPGQSSGAAGGPHFLTPPADRP